MLQIKACLQVLGVQLYKWKRTIKPFEAPEEAAYYKYEEKLPPVMSLPDVALWVM